MKKKLLKRNLKSIKETLAASNMHKAVKKSIEKHPRKNYLMNISKNF